jgi:hypothetical protein
VVSSTSRRLSFRPQQADQAGKEALGVAQRTALDRREQIKVTLGELQAKAAASGGGADDPTIKAIARKIAERGEYEAIGFDVRRRKRRRPATKTLPRGCGLPEMRSGMAQIKARLRHGLAARPARRRPS